MAAGTGRWKAINFASTAGGYASGVAGLLTASGNVFFVKAVPRNSPSAADYLTEARVARALASRVPTPRLLREGSAEGWVLLLFEVAMGQTPDEPWQRDQLLTVMKMLDGLSPRLTPSPVRDLPMVADRMRGRCTTTWSRLLETGSCGQLSVGDLSEWEREHLPVAVGSATAMMPATELCHRGDVEQLKAELAAAVL